MPSSGSPSDLYKPAPHFASPVSIGSRELYAALRGEGPVVVMEPGASGGGSWGTVIEEVAESATVLLYDRAGVGASPAAEDPRTVDFLADDLHALIGALPVDLPVVLVGWSLTGLSALVHAFRFPQDIAGLLLVDPTPHTLYSDPESAAFAPNFKRQVSVQRLLYRCGFGRLWGKNSMRKFLEKNAGQVKDPDVLQAYADSLRYLAASPALRELESIAASCALAANLWEEPFPPVPLIVLSATVNTANHPAVTRNLVNAHKAMAKLSPQGEFRPVEGGSHMMTLDRPDAIVSAVHDILERL